ncbi:MAG TPA: DUF3631 domain-containing protein, partial [Candidatus Acidoferrum sp.]|nr:DUF3631 domain-containing protein [Candidatus Acidoferrum sp.]
GSKIARWTKDNFAAIAACDPVMPPAAYNRLGDNWRPLFALAHIIGGHWPQRVVEAFHALSSTSSSSSSSSFSSSPSPTPPLQLPNSPNHQLPGLHSPGEVGSTLNHQLPQMLLADLRSIFAQSATDRLFSTTLVDCLRALPDRPWSVPPVGTLSVSPKPLTVGRLARYLAPFGIHSQAIRIGSRRAKGYELADFAPAFTHLLGLNPNGTGPSKRDSVTT